MTAGHDVHEALERRYRRLLAWYPPEHRAVYQEEMLAVLLECAGPGRTRPTVAETASLLAGALRSRMRGFGRRLTGEGWRDTAAIVSLLAPAALLVIDARGLLAFTGLWQYVQYVGRPGIGPSSWVPTVVWALVLAGALAGRRVLAAALGWAGLVVEAGVQGLMYQRYGLSVTTPVWLLLALTAALALSVGCDPRRALGRLRPARAVTLTALGALVATWPVLAAHDPSWWVWFDWALWFIGPVALAAVACLVVLVRIGTEVRRRILAVLAPLVVLFIPQGIGDYAHYPDLQRRADWYLAAQAAAALLALAVFWLAVTLVDRRERAIGRGGRAAV